MPFYRWSSIEKESGKTNEYFVSEDPKNKSQPSSKISISSMSLPTVGNCYSFELTDKVTTIMEQMFIYFNNLDKFNTVRIIIRPSGSFNDGVRKY